MRKILLVDDAPEQLVAYQRLLRGRYDVVTATDGSAALDILKHNTEIQAIVSDMSMPCMNGIDFFVHAAELAPHATRIMLTGNTDINATIDAINRGRVFRYLMKPCSRDDLVASIEEGLKLQPPKADQGLSSPVARTNGAPPVSNPMVARLQAAMRTKTLRPFFQPIIDLKTGEMVGAEALARWQHPIDGWIPPSIFIPIAEQYGPMPALGDGMLREACHEAQRWQSLGFDGSVSVNVSATQFAEDRLIEDVRCALDESGLPAARLTLELTESVLVRDPASVIRRLEDLRAIGMTFAIDDFGTGYSSLAYLKHLPVDRLKIDQCFIRDIDRDERDLAFVRAMLDFSRKLDLDVVAEGVERLEQYQILSELGCGSAQGYFFERALDSPSFLALLSGEATLGGKPATSTGSPLEAEGS